MEGYLTLITKGFTSNKQRKVWVVLDRQQLTWYDRLDLTDQLPKKLKGVLFIRDATIKKVSDSTSTHALLIVCNDIKTCFGCENDTVCASWYKALVKALPLHTQEAQKASLPKQYMELLGLDWDEKITKAAIAKAYKRLCLKEHPDKGGDVEKFNQANTAYNYLIALQTVQDELESTVPLQFEATLRKKPGKLGLCMSVNEDRINDRLLVGRVQEEIEIVEIDEEAGGKIKSGDRIIGIDHDDCSHWLLSRLLPRLGATRVPIGGTVVFTFERRVAPDEVDDDDDICEISPQPSPVPSTIIRTNLKTNASDGAPPLTPKSPFSASNMKPINPANSTNNENTTPDPSDEATSETSTAVPPTFNAVPDVPEELSAPLSMPTVSSVSTPFSPGGYTPEPSTPTPTRPAADTAASNPPTPAEARAAALARRKQRLAEESAAESAAPPVVLLMPTAVPALPALVLPASIPMERATSDGSNVSNVTASEHALPLRMESAPVSAPIAVPSTAIELDAHTPSTVRASAAVVHHFTAPTITTAPMVAEPAIAAPIKAAQPVQKVNLLPPSPPPSPPPPPPSAIHRQQEVDYPEQKQTSTEGRNRVESHSPPSTAGAKAMLNSPYRKAVAAQVSPR